MQVKTHCQGELSELEPDKTEHDRLLVDFDTFNQHLGRKSPSELNESNILDFIQKLYGFQGDELEMHDEHTIEVMCDS